MTVALLFCLTASAWTGENINIPDPNLKAALIKAGVDTNGDGEISDSEAGQTYTLDISNSEIKDLTGMEHFTSLYYFTATNNEISDLTPLKNLTGLQTLVLRDNKISDFSPLSNIQNLKTVLIDHNLIGDLTPFVSLKNLEYISVENNLLKTSVARGIDSKTIENLSAISGTVYGAYNQKLVYDETKLSKSAPTYKVLVAVVSEIDATSKIANGKTAESKYKMSDDEIATLKAYAYEFEKYVEKCSDYKLNIEVDFYVTTKKLTTIYAPAAEYGVYSYNVFAPDVPELEPMVNNYDTTITVCYLNREVHSSSGVACYGWNSEYTGKYYGRGVVFVPWDIYTYDPTGTYTVEHANALCYDTLIDTFVHEFTHTLEQYAPVLGYNNIKEFHAALSEQTPQDDSVGAFKKYLSGKSYAGNLTGVPNIVLNTPPTTYKPTSQEPTVPETPTPETPAPEYVKPKNITNLKVSEQGSDYVKLTWTKSSNADGYKVYVYENGSSKAKVTKTVTSNSVKISSLSAGTKYSFCVQPYKYYKADKVYSYGTVSSKVTTQTGPKKITNLKASKIYAKSVTLTWTKSKNASGYEISKYNKSTKKWEKVKTTKETSLKISSLSSATTYKFRVRAYKTVDGKKYYSTAVTISISTKPTAPTISSVKRSGTKITVEMKKVTRAKGYQVQVSTSKNFKKIYKTVNSKNKSVTVKGLKKGQKYYIRVRAYYEVDGKKVYSSYTTYKSAK